MFDIFGENHLTRINTSEGAEDIAAFKNSDKTKKVFKVFIWARWWQKQSKRRHGEKEDYNDGTLLALCEVVLNPRHPWISVSNNALHKWCIKELYT